MQYPFTSIGVKVTYRILDAASFMKSVTSIRPSFDFFTAWLIIRSTASISGVGQLSDPCSRWWTHP